MNGSVLAGIPVSNQNNFRPVILLSKRNPSLPEQKSAAAPTPAIRVFKWQSTDDDVVLLPERQSGSESSVIHKQRQQQQQQRRYSPYERPLQNELNKPIKITKTTKTIIEIDKPHDYFDRKLAEKALAYMTYDQYNDDEDKPIVEVKIEKEENKV